VATSTSSYLQTLPQADAIAFVASLQHLKNHLSEELQQITHQVQQKTVQLEGIETLLAEAVVLGLLPADANVPIAVTPVSQEPIASTTHESPKLETVTPPLDFAHRATSNGEGSFDQEQLEASVMTAPSTLATFKLQAKLQPGTTPKPSGTKIKKLKRSGQSSNKSNSSAVGKELRELLLPKFAGKTLKDTVIAVLETAKKPLHLDELLIEMYGTLPNADFKRAKVSLTNVLSTGKSKGEWQSLGQGLYAANSVATNS